MLHFVRTNKKPAITIKLTAQAMDDLHNIVTHIKTLPYFDAKIALHDLAIDHLKNVSVLSKKYAPGIALLQDMIGFIHGIEVVNHKRIEFKMKGGYEKN